MNGASPNGARRNYKAERERRKMKVPHANTGRKWSAHQHAAFRRTMKKVWKEKRAAEKAAEK